MRRYLCVVVYHWRSCDLPHVQRSHQSMNLMYVFVWSEYLMGDQEYMEKARKVHTKVQELTEIRYRLFSNITIR